MNNDDGGEDGRSKGTREEKTNDGNKEYPEGQKKKTTISKTTKTKQQQSGVINAASRRILFSESLLLMFFISQRVVSFSGSKKDIDHNEVVTVSLGGNI